VLEDFVLSIQTGKSPAIGARDGLRATLLGQKILESMRTGRKEEIRLDELA
jgi:predicted dehydrogenase